ncbi:MAG TPA: plastocyanin/azurin family copper-binding protein, partial [Acidimicrobiia bacterium]|nr:plastocyanin/azurin family copper-binding protein [Acidimicrobiia bacterium]
AADHAVEIRGLSFIPEELAVGVGDTVTWTSFDEDKHDIEGGPLDSPELSKGDTYSAQLNEAGVVDYHCRIHTYMRGTITVGDGGSGEPGSSGEPPSTPPSTAPAPTTTTTRPPSGPLGTPVPAGVG